MISIEWYEKEKHKHHMEVLIRHDRERTPWAERIRYWKEYNGQKEIKN